MKKQNQTTFPTYHHNNNTNYNPNTNNNNNSNTYRTQQNEQITQIYNANNNNCNSQQRHHHHHQHQHKNRCQIIPSEQFLPPLITPPPTQYQRHNQPTEKKFDYQLQSDQPPPQQQQQNSFATMCPATTSGYLPTNHYNNFSNQSQQQYLNYQNQQQPPFQRPSLQQQHQTPNYGHFQLPNYAQQQQPQTQHQRRQQLQLPLYNQNNVNQQTHQTHQKRQLYEQTQQQLQQTAQISGSFAGLENNTLNNGLNGVNGAADNPNCNETEKFPMDANEIANFIANELLMQQLVSVDGIQSGVPTLTTSTLTPTTLKSIEDTFIEIITEPVSYQAGFIPPSLPSTSNNTASSISGTFNGSVHDINEFNDTDSDDSQNSFGRQAYEDYALGGDTTENSSATTDSTSFQNGLKQSSLATSNSNSLSTNDFTAVIGAATGKKKNNVNTSSSATSGVTPPPTRRNQGGRRPAKASNLSPEEEEKRRVRRERNKLAAARCRKRRVDLTNDLLEEVALLEKKRDVLQKDIETLNTQKHELQYILDAHRPTCEKVRQDILTVSTYGGIIAPAKSNNSSSNANITGIDTTLASTGRSSPIDLKPVILNDSLLSVPHIKDEPLDTTLDSNSLDNDDVGPTSPKRMLLSNNNPMIPPPLPKIGTLSPSLAAAASASLHTPIVTSAPVSFGSFGSSQNNAMIVNTLNALNKPLFNVAKQRPTTLPTMPRNPALGLNVENKPPTDINGVAIQTPSTGMFNFDSLMDGGTGLTPVSAPLVPNCSSQNKHPLELTTPTSEPSKLVSL